ncbi:MAG: hypothetical protein R3D68_05855 [Hyphomicrobiaceae bacterium]
MKIRIAIAALLFMMVQAVLFGTAVTVVLSTPLRDEAAALMPLVIVVTALISTALSWWLAPRLRARYWRTHRPLSRPDKALDAMS